MKRICIFLSVLVFFNIKLFSQCPGNGQNPGSAFPVCAATTFTQNTVPACNGRTIPVPPCTGAAVNYTDINPYYYKFTAFQTMSLVFTIKPISTGDDYDWQLFDITGKNPNDIYTNSSLFVACNWSGQGGTTGTSLTATTANGCDGTGVPLITKAPTLIKDHNYLLMVSHFTSTGQSGYNLSFTNADGMVDTTAPNVKNITANCIANVISIKLNKKMKCSSIATDASDISISTNPIINSIVGFGCATSFDTDSITVSLASPLPVGNYTTQIKTGNDGNTILDNCGNGIPDNLVFNFSVVGASQPTLIDSVRIVGCNPQSVQVVFKAPIQCNSVAANGSDFLITGPSTVNISNASVNCNASGLGNIVTLNFASPVNATGNYTLSVQKGSDGSTVLNQCDVATPANTSVTFNAYIKPNPNFTYTIVDTTCKADTLLYTHDGNNGVNKWQWNFDGAPANSALQTQQVVYNSFATRAVKLKVSNPACSDSTTQNIPIADHTLMPKINVSRDTTCPNNPETFIDSSTGNIISRFWDFDNGQTSTSPNPPTQTYPVLTVNKIYATKLMIINAIGCKDSIVKNILVRGTIPAVFDSIIPPVCSATEVKIFFKQNMICSSVALDGSDFSINGVAPNTIISASIACASGVGTVVTLQLAAPLKTGNYSIALKQGSDGNTIVNDCGIATTPSTVSFKFLEHVNPAFTYNAKWGCKQDTILFNHNINNGANKWQWSFTDGSPDIATSNTQSTTVIYSNVATNHNVQLIVGNGVCNDTSNQIVNVIDHSIQAKYVFPDTTCGFGNTVFIDSSKGIITQWNWSFGAGLTSTLKNPMPVNYPLQYVYATYPTQLIVKNIVGCFDTSVVKNIVVKPSSPALMDKVDYNICSPDSFIIYFNSPMLCNTVAVNGSDFAVTGASNPIVSSAYIVNCNNGFGKAVVVKLSSPITVGGYYQINLVKGNDGNTILNDCGVATAPGFIGFVAYNNVDATFTSSIKMNCKADTLLLMHTVANEENKWTWVVNGTAIGVLPSLTIPYRDSSEKNIMLIVSNPSCKDTSSQVFNLVFDKIKARFTVDRDIICPTESVKFSDMSSGKITSWKWDFGNGVINNNPNPAQQNYPVPTDRVNPNTGNTMLTGDNYYTTTASLIVGNAVPCYDTLYQTLKITSNCLIQVPTAFTPNGDGLNDYLYPLNTYKASKFNFRVYNRGGTLMFESFTEGSKWNGKNYLRVAQPAGTYVWTLVYTDKETGKEIFLKGTTVLIK